jgi:hypothetical protein
MTRTATDTINPFPDAEWEIWYQDAFDRECPRRVEVVGVGLVEGLVELWARHLSETVGAGGQRGFSRFNLWWKDKGRSVEVAGDWTGQVRLREWVFGRERTVCQGDTALLARIALAHCRLLQAGRSGETILAAAAAATNPRDFESALAGDL